MADNPDAAQKALSQVKRCVRANYSNPPAHGAAIVCKVLSDKKLREQWNGELTQMRDRINGMRKMFVGAMKEKGVAQDFSFITAQRGMFSFSGLTADQVDRLRAEYSIYIVRSGRINVAGITRENLDRLADAVDTVLKS